MRHQDMFYAVSVTKSRETKCVFSYFWNDPRTSFQEFPTRFDAYDGYFHI